MVLPFVVCCVVLCCVVLCVWCDVCCSVVFAFSTDDTLKEEEREVRK